MTSERHYYERKQGSGMNLLKNGDCHVEVVMLQRGGGIEGGEGGGGLSHELVVLSSMVQVVAQTRYVQGQLLQRHKRVMRMRILDPDLNKESPLE